MRHIDKVLIANRGEITCRIMRTLRRMGIRSVAVYSDADRDALHVRMADEAWRIGPAPATESYLRQDLLIDIARRTGCQAIHPGYGFLSENPQFAAACEAAGIKFIGPSSQSIAAMGSKSAAKSLMEKAAVPLIPGYHGDDQSDARLLEEAQRIGFPLLIKAAFGGGGKGMRVVTDTHQFNEALQSCRREASASFGNPDVLLERYLTQPRHVEVQVFCDALGNAVHLFERDCSIQRRHQKIIEEAPAPGMTAALRDSMGAAAVAAAKAINYEGAGTIEFLLDVDGRFYFMEMNTRLQVEHPVTEYITGLDLVEWQIRVARGEVLPLTQSDLHISGHAIEARICAESPDRQFMPSTGPVTWFRIPEGDSRVRVDTGVAQGSDITPFYDPMIAKLIVHGKTREEARQRMLEALASLQVTGVDTNIHYLHRIMSLDAFAQADLSTRFLTLQGDSLATPLEPDDRSFAAAAMALWLEEHSRVGHSPWDRRDGWQTADSAVRKMTLACGETVKSVSLTVDGQTMQARCGNESVNGAATLHAGFLRVTGDARQDWSVAFSGGGLTLFIDGRPLSFQHHTTVHEAAEHQDPGHLKAPMPGRVTQVLVKSGDKVGAGTTLVIMEAMKMEHSLKAPFDGVIDQVHHEVGDAVREGTELVSLHPAE